MNNETKVLEIFVEDIIPNRFQPRLSFDDTKIIDLANSIKIHGIIQPLVLRQVADKYEIIAGERRYKAAIMAGLQKVPAIISNLDDNQSAEVALVENIQRKDLSAIEEAKSYKKLLDRGYINQEQLALKMGISQSSLSNKLRLLNLDEEIQKALLEEKISERHARSLLSVSDFGKQKEFLQRILTERLTVRQLDEEIKKMNGSETQGSELSIERFDIPIEAKSYSDQLNEPNNMVMEPSFSIEKPVVNEQSKSSFVDLANITKSSEPSFFEPVPSILSDKLPDSIDNLILGNDPIVNDIDLNKTVNPNNENSEKPELFTIDLKQSNNLPANENTQNNEEFKSSNIDDLNKENIQQYSVKIEKSNFRTVEKAFESLKEQIIAAGLKIDMDTYSFDEYYQLIIKVYK